MSELEAASSSSDANVTEMQSNNSAKCDAFVEPEKKRMRTLQDTDTVAKHDLEDRLGGILCCAICLHLPKGAVYQCSNGHLMCAGCFHCTLADARLRDEAATCPNCPTEISKISATRNLAVEKAVSELPSECQYCGKQYPRNSLEKHETTQCEERITGCKYCRIGCPWRGPFHESKEHEKECVHPRKSGAEVMDALQVLDQQEAEEKRLFEYMFILLDYEKITFSDVQLKPYRTEEFVHRLYYETSRFCAFSHQWVIKARVNNNQQDPTQSSERNMTYQVIMKTKTSTPLSIYFLILRGPFGDMKVKPKIYHFNFTEQDTESPYGELPFAETTECNRLLSLKGINCRLLMFMMAK